MPGTVLGAWNTAVYKTNKTPYPKGVYQFDFLLGKKSGTASPALKPEDLEVAGESYFILSPLRAFG